MTKGSGVHGGQITSDMVNTAGCLRRTLGTTDPNYASDPEPTVIEITDEDGTIRGETIDENFEPSDPYHSRMFERLFEIAMRRVADQHG